MRTKGFLTVKANGSLRVSKRKPSLDDDEVVVSLNINLPDSLFEKPQLNAVIEVKDGQVKPFDITPQLIDNIKEAIELQVGASINLTYNE